MDEGTFLRDAKPAGVTVSNVNEDTRIVKCYLDLATNIASLNFNFRVSCIPPLSLLYLPLGISILT